MPRFFPPSQGARALRRFALVQSPGNWATVLRMGAHVPPIHALVFGGRTLAWSCDINATMVDQLCGGLLASPPSLALAPSDAFSKLACQMPLCSQPDWTLRPPSAGFLGLMSLDFATAGGNTMAAFVACVMRLFTPACGNLLVILA